MDPQHGNFDDIRSTPLNGRIDSISLGSSTNDTVLRIDILEVAPTTQNSFDIAILTCKIDLLTHIVF